MYKQHAHGIGPRGATPYRPKTLERVKSAVALAYKQAGVLRQNNPGYADQVSHTLSICFVIMGNGSVQMPEVISPELAKRVIGSLHARDMRHALVAVLLAHGLTLGECASTLFLRDFGEISYTDEGVLIFTPYHKSDKLQVGGDAGIPCCTASAKATHCCTVLDEDGVEFFDMEHFCPACVLKHYVKLLKEKHPELTDADLSGRPLFAEYMTADELPRGLTVVKARAGSNIGSDGAHVVQVPEHVMVVTHEEQVEGGMYRGERLRGIGDRFALARLGVNVNVPRFACGAPGAVKHTSVVSAAGAGDVGDDDMETDGAADGVQLFQVGSARVAEAAEGGGCASPVAGEVAPVDEALASALPPDAAVEDKPCAALRGQSLS